MENKIIDAVKFAVPFAGITTGIIFVLKKLKAPVGTDPSASLGNYAMFAGVTAGADLGYKYFKDQGWIKM